MEVCFNMPSEYSTETLRKLAGRSQSNGLDNILVSILNRLTSLEQDSNDSSQQAIFVGGLKIDGVEIFVQTTKPTLRADNSSNLEIGDLWYNSSNGSFWFWNGTYWLSETTYTSALNTISVSTNATFTKYASSQQLKIDNIFVESISILARGSNSSSSSVIAASANLSLGIFDDVQLTLNPVFVSKNLITMGTLIYNFPSFSSTPINMALWQSTSSRFLGAILTTSDTILNSQAISIGINYRALI